AGDEAKAAGIPSGQDKEHARRIGKALEDNLVNLAYRPMQAALGITDGGYASVFDVESAGPYNSVFGNEVGGDMLAAILAHVGEDAFGERLLRIDDGILPPIAGDIPYSPTDHVYRSLAEASASMIIGRLLEVFPEVPESSLAVFRGRLADHAV